MNAERVDRIIYRFTEPELSGLLQLMGLAELPELSISAAIPPDKDVAGLIESGIITPCGEQTFIDRTIALIIRSAACSRRYIAARSPQGEAVLYQGAKLCVLFEKKPGIVKVEPLQNLNASAQAWMQAVCSLGGELDLLITDQGILYHEKGNPDAAMALLSQMKEE